MKRRRNREPEILSQTRPLTLFFVLCGCILFTFGLIHFDIVLKFLGKIVSALGPVIAGFVIAYLMNPVMEWLEKRLLPLTQKLCMKNAETARKFARGTSSFIAVLLMLLTIALLIAVTFSQVVESVSMVIEKIPTYLEQATGRVDVFLKGDNPIAEYLQQLSDRFLTSGVSGNPTEAAQKIVSAVLSGAAGTLGLLFDVLIGFIIAVYFLFSKELFLKQFKRVIYAIFEPETAKLVDLRIIEANDTFGSAILGKFADSVIIGLLCFCGTSILRIPYATLIAVIVGVTNMIPFFGPIIGAVPCVLLVLMEEPMKSLYLLIFIVVLQQFDCNILDPKIVGKKIGLPAFWELFACLLGGGLFGIVGMVIGVPLFAVLYSIGTEMVAKKLRNKELADEFLRDELGIEPIETEEEDENADRLALKDMEE